MLHLKFFTFFLSCLRSLTVSYVLLIDFTLLTGLIWHENVYCVLFIQGSLTVSVWGFFSVTCLYLALLPARESGYNSFKIRNCREIERHLHLISPKATAGAILVVNLACAYSGIR